MQLSKLDYHLRKDIESLIAVSYLMHPLISLQ